MGVEGTDVIIPVYRSIDTNGILKAMKSYLGTGYNSGCDTIHIDIAHEVSIADFVTFVSLI